MRLWMMACFSSLTGLQSERWDSEAGEAAHPLTYQFAQVKPAITTHSRDLLHGCTLHRLNHGT